MYLVLIFLVVVLYLVKLVSMGVEAMSLDREVRHSHAERNPSPDKAVESPESDVVPFAVVHVTLFKDPSASDVGNSKQHRNPQREELANVLEGFEQVLQVNRHKAFNFLDFVRSGLSDTGLYLACAFFGIVLGMRIQEIIASGVVQ